MNTFLSMLAQISGVRMNPEQLAVVEKRAARSADARALIASTAAITTLDAEPILDQPDNELSEMLVHATHVALARDNAFLVAGTLPECIDVAKKSAGGRIVTKATYMSMLYRATPEYAAEQAVRAAATHPATKEEIAAALKAQQARRTGIVLPAAAMKVASERRAIILAAETYDWDELVEDVSELRRSRYNQTGIFKHTAAAIDFPVQERIVTYKQAAQVAYWAQAIRFLNGKPLLETKLQSVDDAPF